MIFCNNCGNPLDARGLCPECVAQASQPSNAAPPRSLVLNQTIPAVTVQPATLPYQQANSISAEAALGNLSLGPQAAPQKPSAIPKALIVVVAGVGLIAVALLIYFVFIFKAPPSSSSQPGTSTVGSSADDVAAALNKAIDGGRLVNLTGDDAYAYFAQLTRINSQHAALGNARSKVLPQLRNLGEEVIRKKVNHTGEVSEQDWMRVARAYEWAHTLEPNDRALEARQKYVQGKLAEAQNKRGEAWQDFSAAAQFDPSWAVPQNDLGYLIVEDKSAAKEKWTNAVPYYQRAISLQPGWEIPYNNLGTAYYYLDNLDAAEGYYHQAIQRNSNWARPHKWLGDIYSKKNNPGAAIQEYQTAVNLYNSNADSLDITAIQAKIAQLHAKGY